MRFRPSIFSVLLVMARRNVFVKINFSWRCVKIIFIYLYIKIIKNINLIFLNIK
jgi:hypothetical protein